MIHIITDRKHLLHISDIMDLDSWSIYVIVVRRFVSLKQLCLCGVVVSTCAYRSNSEVFCLVLVRLYSNGNATAFRCEVCLVA